MKIENKELGVTYAYTPLTENEQKKWNQDRKKTLQKLLKDYEEKSKDILPEYQVEIFQRNIEWLRGEIKGVYN